MRKGIDFSVDDGTVRTLVSIDEEQFLSVQLTDEGVIFDAFENDNLIGTRAMTYEEWFEAIKR